MCLLFREICPPSPIASQACRAFFLVQRPPTSFVACKRCYTVIDADIYITVHMGEIALDLICNICVSLHLEVFIHGPMLAPAVSQVRPMSTFLGRRLITFVRPRCSLMEGRVGAAGGEGWEKGGGQGSPHLGLQGGANLSSLIRFFKSHSATLSATLFRICTIFSSPQ